MSAHPHRFRHAAAQGAACLILSALAGLPALAVAAPLYRIALIAEEGQGTDAFAINAAGDVVGTTTRLLDGNHEASDRRTFLWRQGRTQIVDERTAAPRGLSDAGEVLYFLTQKGTTPPSQAYHVFRDGQSTPLKLFDQYKNIQNPRLSPKGEVVAYVATGTAFSLPLILLPDSVPVYSYACLRSTASVLAATNGLVSCGKGMVPSAMNDQGVVAGRAAFFMNWTYDNRPATATGTRLQNLASGGATLRGSAAAISSNGWATGYVLPPVKSSSAALPEPSAFFYNGSKLIDLGHMGGKSSEGMGVNAAGTVVGTVTHLDGTSTRAFIYTAGQAHDPVTLLSNPVPGLKLLNATGINDKGQIVGRAVDSAGRHTAYLLTPVP